MALPQIMYPQFDIVVPSLKKKFKFRQFLVKEEKILLVAKASSEESDILTAIKQVVANCALDNSFNVDNISIFDLEYIFLKLRSISVSNVVKLAYRDYEDDKVYDFEVDLNEVEVEFPKNISNKISIIDKTGIVMKYPSASLYSDKQFLASSTEDAAIELIVRCIDKIYDESNIYDAATYSYNELREFVESIDVNTFEKINQFLSNAPKLEYTIKYKNSLGNDREIVLRTLTDFFTLR